MKSIEAWADSPEHEYQRNHGRQMTNKVLNQLKQDNVIPVLSHQEESWCGKVNMVLCGRGGVVVGVWWGNVSFCISGFIKMISSSCQHIGIVNIYGL